MQHLDSNPGHGSRLPLRLQDSPPAPPLGEASLPPPGWALGVSAEFSTPLHDYFMNLFPPPAVVNPLISLRVSSLQRVAWYIKGAQ